MIKKYIDTLIVLFPFEIDWYKKRGVHVKYFGHPLVPGGLSCKKNLHKRKENYTVALCPGSREQEIKKHLPILIQLVQQARHQRLQYNFELFCAPNIQTAHLKSLLGDVEIKIIKKPILHAFQKVDFAIVASGTASLECAITLTPMIVIYKMSFLSWWVARRFIKSPFASIVNILANRLVIPELLQKNLTVSRLLKGLQESLNSPQKLEIEQKKMLNILRPLAVKHVYKNTCSYIYNY